MEYKTLLLEWKKRREEIREKYRAGNVSIRELAKIYGISDARVFVIIHEKHKVAKT